MAATAADERGERCSHRSLAGALDDLMMDENDGVRTEFSSWLRPGGDGDGDDEDEDEKGDGRAEGRRRRRGGESGGGSLETRRRGGRQRKVQSARLAWAPSRGCPRVAGCPREAGALDFVARRVVCARSTPTLKLADDDNDRKTGPRLSSPLQQSVRTRLLGAPSPLWSFPQTRCEHRRLVSAASLPKLGANTVVWSPPSPTHCVSIQVSKTQDPWPLSRPTRADRGPIPPPSHVAHRPESFPPYRVVWSVL